MKKKRVNVRQLCTGQWYNNDALLLHSIHSFNISLCIVPTWLEIYKLGCKFKIGCINDDRCGLMLKQLMECRKMKDNAISR